MAYMPRSNAEPISLRGVHVLVVCDDLQRCTLFAQALRYAGAVVTTSHSADDANAVMDRLRVNVIIVEPRAAEARMRLIASLRARPEERSGKSPALALTRSHEDAEALLESGFQRRGAGRMASSAARTAPADAATLTSAPACSRVDRRSSRDPTSSTTRKRWRPQSIAGMLSPSPKEVACGRARPLPATPEWRTQKAAHPLLRRPPWDC